MQLLSFVAQVSKLWLAAAVFASLLSGLSTMGALICVFVSLRSGEMLWWQFICLGAFSVLCRTFAQFLLGRLTAMSILRLRRRLIRSVLHVPLRDLERIGSERLLAAFTTDLASIGGAVRNVISVFSSSAFLVACMSYLAWFSVPRMAVVASLLVVCIIGAVTLRLYEKSRRRSTREIWDRVVRIFMMMLDGVKQLKISRVLSRKVLNAFETTARAHKNEIGPRSRNYSDAVSTWVQSMFLVILGAAVFIPYGDDIELRSAFGLLAILYLRGPLRSLIQDSAGISDASVALQRITELGLTLDEDRERDRGRKLMAMFTLPSRTWRSLTFRNVTFNYEGGSAEDDFAFGPLNITLHPAEIVFVAGGNGSGKTTFAKLLSGLYTPTAGSITFDDVVVDENSIRQYRSKFAAVFSDFCLFEGVADIEPQEMGRETERLAARLKLKAWMLAAQADGQPAGLSAGERRRVALLMALIEDRPIVLFDEWAADQDPQYKELFYRDILPSLRARGKLTVVLSHDERYFHLGDRVLWLERGQAPVWRSPQSFSEIIELAASVISDKN
jgi:putative ATP-binding cassette transporter